MKFVDGKIVFNEKEKRMFDRYNPNIFSIIVWLDRQGFFKANGIKIGRMNGKDFSHDPKNFENVVYYDDKTNPRCIMHLFDFYHKKLCAGFSCSFDEQIPSKCCMCTRWSEVTGKEEISRKNSYPDLTNIHSGITVV